MRVATPPQVISGCAGRVRIHLSDWAGLSPAALEAGIQGIDGVRRVRANPTTGNVLIEYHEGRVERASLLARAARVSSRSVTVAVMLVTSMPD